MLCHSCLLSFCIGFMKRYALTSASALSIKGVMSDIVLNLNALNHRGHNNASDLRAWSNFTTRELKSLNTMFILTSSVMTCRSTHRCILYVAFKISVTDNLPLLYVIFLFIHGISIFHVKTRFPFRVNGYKTFSHNCETLQQMLCMMSPDL